MQHERSEVMRRRAGAHAKSPIAAEWVPVLRGSTSCCTAPGTREMVARDTRSDNPHKLRTLGPGVAPNVRCATAQTIASSRSGERPLDNPSRPKSHISSSSAGKRAGVLHPALLVERGHRLGAQPLAARRAHRDHRHLRIGLADHRRTMSPPWLTSTTSASASSRATARWPRAQPAGVSPAAVSSAIT